MRSGERMESEVPSALAAVLDLAPSAVSVRPSSAGRFGVNQVVRAADTTFVVEAKTTSGAGPVARAAEQARAAVESLRVPAVPLVAVPFMGEAGRRVCAERGVSWLDLSGNAHIVAPGLRVIIDGRPNRFRPRGRPTSVFAPKSARVTRFLLQHPDRAHIQRELALAVRISEGFVSRIVARLIDEHYLVREESGSIRVRDPRLLLEAWRDDYRFSKHTIVKGHLAARSGEALALAVSEALGALGVEHAATGLAAAYQLTHFAAYRTTTFYLERDPRGALAEELGFREDSRGANLWLVLPNDEGVYQGAAIHDGIRCVHPVQAYLDLKEHPERASEAAERLRTERLGW